MNGQENKMGGWMEIKNGWLDDYSKQERNGSDGQKK